MRSLIVSSFLLCILLVDKSSGTLDIYYMDEICGSTVDLAEIQSASVETSKALTYPNNLNCIVTYTAPAGKRFYLQMSRFVTEQSLEKCYDYLSVYDGSTTSSTPLISKLCGELTGEPTYTTTGDSVTFEFVSDESAKDRGYAVFLIAFTPGPTCSPEEILCASTDMCIDKATSSCDDYEHCDDGTDEVSCAVTGDDSNGLAPSTIGLIVGLVIGGVILSLIIFLLVRWGYKKYQWNQYLKQLAANKATAGSTRAQALQASKKKTTSYPLTHQYQNEEFINITRAQRDAALLTEEEVIQRTVTAVGHSRAALGSHTNLSASPSASSLKESTPAEKIEEDNSSDIGDSNERRSDEKITEL